MAAAPCHHTAICMNDTHHTEYRHYVAYLNATNTNIDNVRARLEGCTRFDLQ